MKLIRFLFRFIIALLIAVIIVCIGLYASGNAHLVKAVRSTYLQGKTGPTINDYTKFDNRIVASGSSYDYDKTDYYNRYELKGKLLDQCNEMETVALLVLKDGKLAYEKYWNSYSDKSKTNSFSMAKSFTSLCIGAAIKEGKIKSVQQKVGDFLPEFSKGEKATVTIEHLLTMSSGIDFGESYGDPFGFMARTYYGTDLYELTINKPLKHSPGTVWQYQGGNTLLLSFIIEKATGTSLSDYFSEHFWKPMGAKENALWTLNEEGGREKSYCCFYSNASDYARIGQLILNEGVSHGKSLIDKSYLKKSLQPVMIKNSLGKMIDYYGYQWWLGNYKGVSFSYARGILGQYIVSIPEWNTVVVRLGHKRDPEKGAVIPKDLFTYLDVAKEVINNR